MRAVRFASVVAALLMAGVAAAQPGAPELRIEAPADRPQLASRLQPFDSSHLRTIARLVGLQDPGAPIRVVLVDESSAVARATPSWIAGFARGSADTIVLFPSRSPSYPHGSLDAVLQHEVAHVLVHRAARGHDVPRWFDEGLATVAERAWTFEDRRQLAWALAMGPPADLRALDRAFGEDPGSAARAYAIAGAFTREIIDRHGVTAPGRILAFVAQEVPFDAAFASATGEPLHDAERAFRARMASWERWIPLATSPFVLWTATTGLAVYAIWVARVRRAKRRRLWDEEPNGDREDRENHDNELHLGGQEADEDGERGDAGPTVVQ